MAIRLNVRKYGGHIRFLEINAEVVVRMSDEYLKGLADFYSCDVDELQIALEDLKINRAKHQRRFNIMAIDEFTRLSSNAERFALEIVEARCVSYTIEEPLVLAVADCLKTIRKFLNKEYKVVLETFGQPSK